MIYEKLLNTNNEADVVFDICIPCWENSKKLNETIGSIVDGPFKAELPIRFIICVEKQSVVNNRLGCLTRSKSKYVLWLDDDIAFKTPGWDKHLYNKIIDNPTYGVIGVNVVHYQAADNSPTREEGETSGVCGAVMMTRKIDGIEFDINYIGSQWEDTDYCVNCTKNGYKVLQDNSLWVLHYNEEKNRDYTHNRAYFIKKWGLIE